MIKQINHQNILTTPFIAEKSWEMYNVDSNDLVLQEPYSSSWDGLSWVPTAIPDTNTALEYVQYTETGSVLNRDCNIALEQQTTDLAIFQEGINVTSSYDPSANLTNLDGTYKWLVYSQIKNSFYNSYNNPLQIFGVEYFDFPLSKTVRHLANNIKIFTIPQKNFGDTIKGESVEFFDAAFNDNNVIRDDGYQNLWIGENLFSNVQEVRALGSIPNLILDGDSGYIC